jgi:ATP citrate (pro-S)-lyase
MYCENGGVDVGDVDTKADTIIILVKGDYKTYIKQLVHKELVPLVLSLYEFYKRYHMVLLEVNPIALTDNGYVPLDFAVKYDTTGQYLWNMTVSDELDNRDITQEEKNIEDLDAKTGSSLKFKLLNPTGKIWLLVAGGGASVLYTDAIINMGLKDELANYGEYSGNPPAEFVYQYVINIFKLMFKTSGTKYLLVGGSIANFTDVNKTFQGILKGIDEFKDEFVKNMVQIFVRRGGPNYLSPLENFKRIALDYDIPCETYGPEMDITGIVSLALGNIERDIIATIDEDIEIIDLDPKDYITEMDTFYNRDSRCFIYGLQKIVVERMLDFDAMCERDRSVACLIDPTKKNGSSVSVFWKDKEILVPVYSSLSKACELYPDVSILINFSSFRSAYNSSLEAIHHPNIKMITIIAEGIPERITRELYHECREHKTTIIGPSTVGAIKSNCFRVGNTGGELRNLYGSKLYHSGSIAFVTRSGGLLNEMCNIITRNTDCGIYEGVSIGGDRIPCSNFIDHLIRFEKDPNVKILILLGEVGGIQEIIVANAVKR